LERRLAEIVSLDFFEAAEREPTTSSVSELRARLMPGEARPAPAPAEPEAYPGGPFELRIRPDLVRVPQRAAVAGYIADACQHRDGAQPSAPAALSGAGGPQRRRQPSAALAALSGAGAQALVAPGSDALPLLLATAFDVQRRHPAIGFARGVEKSALPGAGRCTRGSAA